MMEAESETKAIEEAQMFAVAGMSLTRQISADDIRWAVEKGFKAGSLFTSNKQNSVLDIHPTKQTVKKESGDVLSKDATISCVSAEVKTDDSKYDVARKEGLEKIKENKNGRV